MALFNADGDLLGKRVVCGDGRDLGEVKDLQIDADAWYVRGVVVRLRRDVLEELNEKSSRSSSSEVLVSSRQVQGVSDRVLLSPSFGELAKLAFPDEGPGLGARRSRDAATFSPTNPER